MSFVVKILTAIALLVSLAACAAAPVPLEPIKASPAVIASQQRFTSTYLINSGDILEVVVDRAPELGRTITVGPDGIISIPGAGVVRVAGLSASNAARQIERALSDRLVSPEVTVIVTNPPIPSVFVTGEVGGARSVPLRDATTAAEALVLAGGLQRTASMNNLALIRLDSDGYIRARMIEAPAGGQPQLFLALSAVTLQAGDVLVVPESQRSLFVRSLNDFITSPLVALNAILTPFVQFELLKEFRDD